MAEIYDVSRAWATRPDEDRYTDLLSMQNDLRYIRDHSEDYVLPKSAFAIEPDRDSISVVLDGKHAFKPNHHSFGQLTQLAGWSAGDADNLRQLPPELVAANLNYLLRREANKPTMTVKADTVPQGRRLAIGAPASKTVDLAKRSDASVLVQFGERDDNGDADNDVIRAILGDSYGRIWNSDVIDMIVDKFGDGRTGNFRVPGEFGKEVAITKANTTLYASDRDMIIMLADEKNRVELPGRRDGSTGSFARGFIVSNSEVGTQKFRLMSFYFDYVCANRIIWGATNIVELQMRHSRHAAARFLKEAAPALQHLTQSDDSSKFLAAINAARNKTLDDKHCEAAVASIVGKRKVLDVYRMHEANEGRPIETVYDVVNGVTDYAKRLPYAADRLVMEAEAAKLLSKAA